jgi:hypothetical protein
VTALPAIGGRRTRQLELKLNGACPEGAPRIYVAEVGFAALNAGERETWPSEDFKDIAALATAMRNAREGLFIAFVDRTTGPRPLVLIQDDRGAFYEDHQPRADVAWRDFYFAAGHVALDWMDWRWQPRAAEVRNLSGGPNLPRDAATAFLEGVGFLLDRRGLALRTLCLSGHGAALASEVARAQEILSAEQSGQKPPRYRPLMIETYDPEMLTFRGSAVGIHLLRINLS